MRSTKFLPGALLCLLAAASPAIAATPTAISYARLPLLFEKNNGQAPATVEYLAHAGQTTLLLQRRSARFLSPDRSSIEMVWEAANSDAKPAPGQPKSSYTNYYFGQNPANWHTHVPHYGEVRYRSVYPGIDLVFHGSQKQLEYDFVLAPVADPERIQLHFPGAAKVELSPEGELILSTKSGGTLRQRPPSLFQEVNGQQRRVSGRYVAKSNGRFGFHAEGYDRTRPLTIDPVLVYSTYLGGTFNDVAYGLAVDSAGNMYLGGMTSSSDFPLSAAAQQTLLNQSKQNDSIFPNQDGFVAKLSADGSQLLYSTYFGGSKDDSVLAIAVDGSGNLYATGSTASTNLPTTNGAYKISTTLDSVDAFALKLDANGQLVYSTYLGGNPSNATGTAIAIDPKGQAYIAGNTAPTSPSVVYPTTAGAYRTTTNGTGDAFVSVINASGSGVVYSTLIGGAGNDRANGIVLAPNGNVTITGYAAPSAYIPATGSYAATDFPTTPGVVQTKATGNGGDGFVAQFNATGTALVFSTLLGGSFEDVAYAIATDAAGNFYVTGGTESYDFPVTAGAYRTGGAGFVAKLNSTATSLVYSARFGTAGGYSICYNFFSQHGCEAGAAIVVDPQGSAYVTGNTQQSNFPTTPGALETTDPGYQIFPDPTSFLLRLTPSGAAASYSSYLGGSLRQDAEALALDGIGNLYLAGGTASGNFPVTANAYQAVSGSKVNSSTAELYFDAFLAKISMSSPTSCSVSVAPATITFPGEGGTAALTVTAPDGCPWTVNIGTASLTPQLLYPAITPRGGVGSSTITLTAPLNNSNAPLYNILTVGGQSVTLTQTGVACTYTLNATSATAPAVGGSDSVKISTPAGCPWQASSSASWLTIFSVGSMQGGGSLPGAGDGSVNFTEQPNMTSTARTGTLTVAGQTFTVTQPGQNCTYSLPTSASTVGGLGATGTISLITGSGCAWIAQSNAPWLSLSTPAGTSSGNVTFTAQANLTGATRTGTLTVATQTYTVTQPDGTASCVFTVSPTSLVIGPGASTGTLSITGPSACPWSFASSTSWLTVYTYSTSPTGSGTLTYSVSSNSGAQRSATITVANQTVTVFQNGPGNSALLLTSIGVFRPTAAGNVLWLRDRNGDGIFTTPPDTYVLNGNFGAAGDIPLIGDWNGSGTKKIGVYRPFNSPQAGAGLFILDTNGDEQYTPGVDTVIWFPAQAGDVPLVGKWGGGKADRIGLFRNGVFYLDPNGDGSWSKTAIIGQAGDTPVVGDWNGSGFTKVGVFRSGFWVLDLNGNGRWDGPGADQVFYLGTAGDTPVVGDWNGSGFAKAGVYRSGLWVLDYNGNYLWDGPVTDRALFNGTATDTPLVADWNGDGKSKAGVFHNGTFFLDVLANGSFSRLAFLGQAGDTPIVGNW